MEALLGLVLFLLQMLPQQHVLARNSLKERRFGAFFDIGGRESPSVIYNKKLHFFLLLLHHSFYLRWHL
ncbi:hypothetical protein AAIM60_18470 [Pseudomonas lijiangensis]|uniref:hypothetical protein n=1 Tax=Pseudomonas lijiangensis TaxID=2995658 RepID=UPI0031BB06F5